MFLAGFSQALGDFCFSEASRLIYIHMSKPVDSFFFFFFQEEADNDFCIQQRTAWVEGMGFSY